MHFSHFSRELLKVLSEKGIEELYDFQIYLRND